MPDMTTREEQERRDSEDRRGGDRRTKEVLVRSVRRLLPIEFVVGLTLIGSILVGAVLYSNSIRFQRFIEPVIAVLQPRGEFSSRFKQLILEEFEVLKADEIVLHGNILRVRRSFLTDEGSHRSGFRNFERLGRVFLGLMEDKWMRANTDFIMVSLQAPYLLDEEGNRKIRQATARDAELVLVTVLNATPELRAKYAPLFTSSVISSPPGTQLGEWVTFHIMPSERFHEEVLKRLEKYVP